MDMKGVTREEAVLFLLSLQEQIDLIVQHRRQEYDQVVASGKGDSFHIKYANSNLNRILKNWYTISIDIHLNVYI